MGNSCLASTTTQDTENCEQNDIHADSTENITFQGSQRHTNLPSIL